MTYGFLTLNKIQNTLKKKMKGALELIAALKAKAPKEEIMRIILHHPSLMAAYVKLRSEQNKGQS